MKEQLASKSIVDVRSPEEFAGGHFPNAINIPVDKFTEHIQRFKEMPKPIVTYCRSGARSGMAVSILKQNGIPEVYNGGGLDEMFQQLK